MLLDHRELLVTMELRVLRAQALLVLLALMVLRALQERKEPLALALRGQQVQLELRVPREQPEPLARARLVLRVQRAHRVLTDLTVVAERLGRVVRRAQQVLAVQEQRVLMEPPVLLGRALRVLLALALLAQRVLTVQVVHRVYGEMMGLRGRLEREQPEPQGPLALWDLTVPPVLKDLRDWMVLRVLRVLRVLLVVLPGRQV